MEHIVSIEPLHYITRFGLVSASYGVFSILGRCPYYKTTRPPRSPPCASGPT